MTTQVSITSLVFGSIIEGQYNGLWYKVRYTRKNRAGVSIEWLEGPMAGKEDYRSNYTITNTNYFRKWNQNV